MWLLLSIFYLILSSRTRTVVRIIFQKCIRSDHSLSRVRLFVTPWIAARQASLSITNSQNSLRLTSIESVMPSNHFILCHPLILLPSIVPSIRVFSNELALRIRWPNIGASTSVLPMNIQGWFPLGLTGLIPLLSKGLSRVFSSTIVRKHQFFHALRSLKSNSHIHTRLLERPQPWLYGPLSAKWCLCFLTHCQGLS